MIETENFFLLEMLQLEPVRQTFFWRRGASCCSSKAKKSWLSSFAQGLLSLVLMAGLLGTLFSFFNPDRSGSYGPMPGSEVNHDLEPQWRGHYLDKSGFYYMGARYYDPQAGRFLSPDPLGHDASLDLYSYCNGDPVNGLDPDGRCAEGASAGWGNGEGQFAGMYDSSQANSQLGYNLGWTAGAAAGDVNAVVGAVGNGINATVDFAEDIARVPRGSLTAGSFMFGPEVGGAVSGLRAWGSAMKAGGAVETIVETPLLTQGSQVPNAGGVIRSFVQEADRTYYRVFSENPQGAFLTAVKPRSSSFAQEALALPPGNTANFVQEVLVPAGTRLQRSRALAAPEFGRMRGGGEQFQLLDSIPNSNFSQGLPLQ